jgi:DNA repair protein RecO (recombination protein O)
MLQKTEGIVIHTIPYSDTSIIAKLFTTDYGLVSFMIKGTRGKKTTNKAVLYQPLSVLAIDIYYQENKNLQTIKETKLLLNPVGIYSDIHKTSVVLFMAEVLQKLLKENYINPSLFILLKHRMEELNDQPFNPDFHLKLMVDIATELGFLPFDNYSASDPVFSLQEGKFVSAHSAHSGMYFMNALDSKHFHLLISGNELTMDRDERRSLLAELLKYFQFHNPGMNSIRSMAVLQEVL